MTAGATQATRFAGDSCVECFAESCRQCVSTLGRYESANPGEQIPQAWREAMNTRNQVTLGVADRHRQSDIARHGAQG